MILLEGIARSGTSLLGRLMELLLRDEGYAYYYEPFHHPTPAGIFPDWKSMIGKVLAPGDSAPDFSDYLRSKLNSARAKIFWKEIRLPLKQDWLLREFPALRIVHLTRDILGVWSSHRRLAAPDWMTQHRDIWVDCARSWSGQMETLKRKQVPHLDLLKTLEGRTEIESYAILWTLSESFAWHLDNKRILCVEYEDLCLFPLETMRRIAKFLGVPFGERLQHDTLRHLAESEKEFDPSGPGTGRSAKEMAEIWRERLTKEEIHAIAGIAGGVRSELGYPTV